MNTDDLSDLRNQIDSLLYEVEGRRELFRAALRYVRIMGHPQPGLASWQEAKHRSYAMLERAVNNLTEKEQDAD